MKFSLFRFLDLLTQRRRETADALNATATSNALPAPAPVLAPALQPKAAVTAAAKAQVPKVEVATEIPNPQIPIVSNSKSRIFIIII